MNFTKKCHNSKRILQSTLQSRNRLNDDVSVINCDIKNQILNDHLYETEVSQVSTANNSISEETNELEMPNKVKSEVDILDMATSEVLELENMLKKDVKDAENVYNMLQQEVTIDQDFKCDNTSEIDIKEDVTNSTYLKIRKDLKEPNKLNKKYEALSQRSRPYCGYCKQEFPTTEILQQHRQTVHAMNTVFTCEYCPKRFKKKVCKNVHMRTHTKERPYQCDHCGQRFSLNSNLKRHKMVHTGEKRFTCEHCGKGFIQLASLQNHLLVHTYEKLTCETCGNNYSNIRELKNHIKHVHSNELPENINKFECSVCSAKLSSKASLQFHMLTHTEGTFLCDDCGKGFKTKMALDVHQVVHTGLKLYGCNICQRRFTQAASLRCHRRTHTGWY